MPIRFSNNAITTLASSISNSATSLTVAAGDGDNFPAVLGGSGDYFVILLENALGQIEEIRVNHRPSGSDTLGSASWPLQRGYFSTTARAWSAGDVVDLRLSAGLMETVLAAGSDLSDHVNDPSAAHAASAISFSAAGQVSSTNLQAAIEELDQDLSATINTLNTLKAPLASPALTGTPTVPDPASSATNNGQIPNTKWVQSLLLARVGNSTTAPTVANYSGITGEMRMWLTNTPPPGWMLAHGNVLSQTTYAALFAVYGTQFNTGGEPAGTFRIPDMRGMFPVGATPTGAADYQGPRATRPPGTRGGAETHTLTTDEMPAHNHGGATGSSDVNGSTIGAGSTTGVNAFSSSAAPVISDQSHTHTISSQGGGAAHNNMPPFYAVNFMIKL